MKPIQKLLGRFAYINILPRDTIPTRHSFTGHTGSMPSKSRAFILDFDGTITEKDTIGVVANCGIEWQARRGVDMKGVWEGIVGAYTQDFGEHVESYRPVREERRTLDEEIRWQRSLRDVEEKSFSRVSESGIFEGMGRGVWEDAGRQAVARGDVVVRIGFQDFLERLRGRGDTWGIASVNFSSSFIRGVVGASAVSEKDVLILANSPDDSGVLIGPESNSGTVVATSDAKLASMKALLQTWADSGLDVSKPVYVGDSGSDIECLLDLDVTGVVLSDFGKSGLVEALKRIGIDPVPIREYVEGNNERRIYLARDFDDIFQSRLLSSKSRGQGT